MGWFLAGVVLLAALMVIYAAKAVMLLGRGIVLLAVALGRAVLGLLR